jgi:hypothetical protein
MLQQAPRRRPVPGGGGRRTVYFALMGTAVVLILLAWNVVRLWSVPAAVIMSVIAAPLPPIAVIVANRHLD